MPNQASARMMPSVHSGRLRVASVSSTRSTMRPSGCCCARAQLNSAERAPPTWNMPVGEGAKRVRREVSVTGSRVSVDPTRPGRVRAAHIDRVRAVGSGRDGQWAGGGGADAVAVRERVGEGGGELQVPAGGG